MPSEKSNAPLVIALTMFSVAMSCFVVFYSVRKRPAPPAATQPATIATTTTAPSTSPATTRAAAPPVRDFLGFARAVEPRLAKVAPLSDPLTLEVAAGLVTRQPLHIDFRGDLWVTHPEAPPIAEVLRDAGKAQAHLTRDEVVFAYWLRDARGDWVAQAVTRTRAPGGHAFTWHHPSGPTVLARTDYRFDAALLLPDGRVVVPTGSGVVALTPPPAPIPPPRRGERLPSPTATTAPSTTPALRTAPLERGIDIPTGRTPVVVFPVGGGNAARGAVAFRPWDNGDTGSSTVHRLPGLLDAEQPPEWVTFDAEKFPARPVHAFALTDGATLVLSAGEDAGLDLEVLLPFEPRNAPPDERQLAALIDKLSDANPRARKEAQNDLARFGPSAWPVLERVREAQTPEAQLTIDRLLGARARPTLGIFSLLPGPVRLVARGNDGALLLQCAGGVVYLDLGRDTTRAPALLLARPGAGVVIAPEPLSEAAENLGDAEFRAQLRGGEVVLPDPARGPVRLLSNHLAPMLRPEYLGFLTWLGSDRAGRSLFQNPASDLKLILDPTLPDPTPRLPAWVLDVEEGDTGWDAAGHLALRRGGAWRLARAAWEPLDEKAAPLLLTEPTPLQRRNAATVTLSDGRRVTAGTDVLEITAAPTSSTRPSSTGPSRVVVRLPESALGTQLPTLVRGAGDLLFLFNRPGRVVRLAPTDDGSYAVDATFDEDIPDGDIRRIWTDPFGRLCIAHGRGGLTVLFPEGRIPSEILPLMTRRAKRQP